MALFKLTPRIPTANMKDLGEIVKTVSEGSNRDEVDDVQVMLVI